MLRFPITILGVYEVPVTIGEANWVIKIDFLCGKISIADKSQAVEVMFRYQPQTHEITALFEKAKFSKFKVLCYRVKNALFIFNSLVQTRRKLLRSEKNLNHLL